MEQKHLRTNFLALKLMRYFGPHILFYAIWNKGLWDHTYLTDGMQWQKKSKKNIYIYILIKLMSEFQKELDVQKVRAVDK